MKGVLARCALTGFGLAVTVVVSANVVAEAQQVPGAHMAATVYEEAVEGHNVAVGYMAHRALEARDRGTEGPVEAVVTPEPVLAGIEAHVQSDWEVLIVVDPSTSTGWATTRDSILLTFDVATGVGGLSNTPGSNGTPVGSHKIWKTVVGEPQEILQGRQTTGRIAEAETGKGQVVSGLIALAGLEERNQSSYARTIYIHGTNYQSSLGNGVGSQGCVRVDDATIYALIDLVESHTTEVHILDRAWTGS